MDITKINYFFAAAELQNFTQAADKCNIAQTTMSKYILQLEKEVGVPLFHRTNKGCSLTDQGKMYYTGMKKITAEYGDLMFQMLEDERAELRIGIEGGFFKLASLQAFEDNYRNMILTISFDARDKLFEDLLKQHIHAVILPEVLMTDEYNNNELSTIELLAEQGLLTYSALTQDRFATIEEMIETIPLITKSSDRAYHDHCRKVFMDHYGADLKEIMVVDSASRQQLLVSLSQGFSIIPASEIASGLELRQRPIADEFKEALVLVYNRKHIPVYLKEFIRFAKTQVRS